MVKCCECEKDARFNYQKLWVRWGCIKDDGYTRRYKYLGMKIEEPIGNDNLHYCKEHSKQFEEGKI